MKSKAILITLAVLFVCGIAAILVGRQIVVGYLTPEFLTEQIESRWNCRAQIESVEANVLGTSQVSIKNLSIFPRDEVVEKGGLISDRTPLPTDTAEISAEAVDLEIKTGDLIARRLRVNHLKFNGVSVKSVVSTEGESSLSELFQSLDLAVPETPGDKPTTPGDGGAVAETGVDTPDEAAQSEEATEIEETDAEKLPMAVIADRMEINNGEVDVLLEASGATVYISDFSIAFTDIDVNPRDLNAHNRSSFQFGGDLKVVGADKSDLAIAHISGMGDLKPFNSATGAFDPAWAVDLTLSEGATLNTFPVLEKLREMLGDIDTAGIDLSDLTLRGELMADATTQITQYQGKYRFDKPMILQLPDTGLMIKEKSWIDTASNQHQIKGSLILSKEITDKVEVMVDQYLATKTKGLRLSGLKDIVLSPVKKDNRIVLDVISEGDMSDPKADIETPFGNLSKVIGGGKDAIDNLEKAGKSLLDSILGN